MQEGSEEGCGQLTRGVGLWKPCSKTLLVGFFTSREMHRGWDRVSWMLCCAAGGDYMWVHWYSCVFPQGLCLEDGSWHQWDGSACLPSRETHCCRNSRVALGIVTIGRSGIYERNQLVKLRETSGSVSEMLISALWRDQFSTVSVRLLCLTPVPDAVSSFQDTDGSRSR